MGVVQGLEYLARDRTPRVFLIHLLLASPKFQLELLSDGTELG
jgi:hypothetical protein